MHIETDTHTHTISSGHAYSSLQENVAAAKAAGLKLLAMTDHASSMPGAPHIWFFGNLKVVPRFIDGVGVLRGVEANILNVAGEIDVPEKILNQLDIVIGSLHEPVFTPATREENTQALVNTIKSGRVDIIGHPGNPSFPIDIDTVVQAAAEYQVLIELNNSSFLGSRAGSHPYCVAIAQAAKEYGAWLTLGSDSHISFTIGKFAECEAVLQQVGFPLERVISTDANKLLDFLENRGHKNIREYADKIS